MEMLTPVLFEKMQLRIVGLLDQQLMISAPQHEANFLIMKPSMTVPGPSLRKENAGIAA